MHCSRRLVLIVAVVQEKTNVVCVLVWNYDKYNNIIGSIQYIFVLCNIALFLWNFSYWKKKLPRSHYENVKRENKITEDNNNHSKGYLTRVYSVMLFSKRNGIMWYSHDFRCFDWNRKSSLDIRLVWVERVRLSTLYL